MAGYIVSGRSKILDLTGMVFAHLTVLSFAGKDRCGNKLWLCRCECGTEKVMGGGHLKAGTIISCGCVGKSRLGHVSRTHGKRGTPEYNVWCTMRARCANPKSKKYARYGGRGITVCERWLTSFENFYADMGPRPSPKYSVERKDNDGDYCPENCVWATAQEQQANTSRTSWLTLNGRTLTVPQWSQQTGMSVSMLHRRIDCGWTDEEVLTIPKGRRRRSLSNGGVTFLH